MWRFYEKGKNGGNCLRLMLSFDVYNNVSLQVFFPFGINLSLYDRKYESDQNRERSQLKRFPHGEDL